MHPKIEQRRREIRIARYRAALFNKMFKEQKKPPEHEAEILSTDNKKGPD